jgi:hypothetical protein
MRNAVGDRWGTAVRTRPSRRLLLRTVILRDVGVVARGSVGCSVVLERFGVVLMRRLGVVGRGRIHRRVEFRCLSDVVLGDLGAVTGRYVSCS